jgi:hypothetical protein
VSATRPYRNIAGDHLNQNLHHAQGQHLQFMSKLGQLAMKTIAARPRLIAEMQPVCPVMPKRSASIGAGSVLAWIAARIFGVVGACL